MIRAAGMMSGTSLDGVDLAVIETDGIDVFEFAESAYRPYTPHERDVLRAALGKWPSEDGVAELVKATSLLDLWVVWWLLVTQASFEKSIISYY